MMEKPASIYTKENLQKQKAYLNLSHYMSSLNTLLGWFMAFFIVSFAAVHFPVGAKAENAANNLMSDDLFYIKSLTLALMVLSLFGICKSISMLYKAKLITLRSPALSIQSSDRTWIDMAVSKLAKTAVTQFFMSVAICAMLLLMSLKMQLAADPFIQGPLMAIGVVLTLHLLWGVFIDSTSKDIIASCMSDHIFQPTEEWLAHLHKAAKPEFLNTDGLPVPAE